MWSVRAPTHNTFGNAYITIKSAPARLVDGVMTEAEGAELAKLLDVPLHKIGSSGIDVPTYGDFPAEYIDRAWGREPAKHGTVRPLND